MPSFGLRYPRSLATLSLGMLYGCLPTTRPTAVVNSDRVIVLSIDSFNEQRIRTSLPPEATAGIRALLDGAACGTAQPAFPSLTSPGHAALWTGAYGDVTGISGNVQSRLPRDLHTLLNTGSGFSAIALRAEPIWITTALAGVRTAGHHATQSPGIPGFPRVTSNVPESAREMMRARAASALASPALHLVNGYDEHVIDDMVLTAATHAPRTAARWTGLAQHEGTDGIVVPKELAVAVGGAGDSLFVLFTGRDGQYTHALLAASRNVALAAIVFPHPADTAAVAGRELARFFSEPFAVTVGGRTFHERARLFELVPDGTRFMMFLPGISVTAANHSATRDGYDTGTRGWVANSASGMLARGAFGTQLAAGGDGLAEQRWLETAELATLTSIDGARWMWRTLEPRLMLDYFAIGDDTDHLFWGLVTPGAPGFDAAVAQRVQRVRAHAWSLVDARIAAVYQLARASAATLLLSGDHGMRPYWRLFRPNVALAQAGLLTTDSAGLIVPSESRAMSPNGYWISVNRTVWRDGAVPPSGERAVIDSVVRVLANARGADGRQVVSRIYLATEHDSLGLGGPVGGDVYYELTDGYYYNSEARGPLTNDVAPRGGHGYPSVAADMQTAVCASGRHFGARRIGTVRLIDLAPTVLELLGVAPAATVRGRSLLAAMRQR